METKLDYEKINNLWNIIIDFLDMNSIFQFELSTKYFRNRLLSYYENKESLLKNNNTKNDEGKKNIILSFSFS